ncbi:hypothetical protein KPG71_04690 [Roseovarius sp. PS-C2]|uniref:hypothetical protein n=1 Tax=Roseovarius sp. PS-C2 TaxID=2820814 RepID=UPI001C0C914C|nr:hypothetical protein [Roseovarius sp. PS-C2]MBU3259307.1 hypothetical protein [Roseovarius sp. PS-C2]
MKRVTKTVTVRHQNGDEMRPPDSAAHHQNSDILIYHSPQAKEPSMNEHQMNVADDEARETVEFILAQSRAGGTCPIQAMDGLIFWAKELIVLAESAKKEHQK